MSCSTEREYYLSKIFVSSPIDKQTRIVTSQAKVSDKEYGLTREDLSHIKKRMLRKHQLLKHVLGIKTKSQLTNTRYKARKGIAQFRQAKNPRAVLELMRIGDSLELINKEQAFLRKIRQLAAVASGYKIKACDEPKVMQLAASIQSARSAA